MRSNLKGWLEVVLARGGPADAFRRLHRRRTLVLAYHNVVPDEGDGWGDPSLHLARSRFASQLDELCRTHEIVPLDSLSEGRRRTARPRAVITFDDAYRGAVTIGVEELARRGLPATIFVAPALLDGRAFWWDALSCPRDGLDADLRRRALGELKGDDAAVREWARQARRPARAVPAIARSATEAELRSAVRHPGITLASHGWRHRNLTRLVGRELIEEIPQPLEWLRARFDAVLPWFSYPYGLASPAVRETVSAYGYEGAVRVGGGPAYPGRVDRFAVPRQNVPSGVSPDGFSLRVAGIVRS